MRYSNLFQYTYKGKKAYLSAPSLDSKFYGQFVSTLYTVGSHDRLDTIAFKYYGTGELWWLIAQANDLELPTDLKVGAIIVIPLDHKNVLQSINRVNNIQ